MSKARLNSFKTQRTLEVGGNTYQYQSLPALAEAGFANAVDRGGNWLWGFSPLMAQYKFLSPNRKWAPNILAGAGFSYGDWNDLATREIATPFEFLLHIGAGLEFYNQTNAWSVNYRLFHVSNAGIEFPNIGLNAHVFSLGMRF